MHSLLQRQISLASSLSPDLHTQVKSISSLHGNVGASKRLLSNDLKTKIVPHRGLGEAHKKLGEMFQLRVSTERKVVRKWKTAGTVLVQRQRGEKTSSHRAASTTYTFTLLHMASLCIVQVFSALCAIWGCGVRVMRNVDVRFAEAHEDKPASFWN